MNPRRDWKILLIIFTVVVFVSAVYGIRVFMQIDNDTFLPENKKTRQPKTIDRDRLQEIVERFEAKDRRFESPQGNPMKIR
jgi:hypothetical protein